MEKLDIKDVDKLRFSYEIDEHWKYRQDFLLAHADNLPKDRLLCLAQIYVNMKILHVEYNEQVVKEVQELARQIPKH